jgi:hypothetical protein
MLRQAVSDHYINMHPLQKLLEELFPKQKTFNITVCFLKGEDFQVHLLTLAIEKIQNDTYAFDVPRLVTDVS